MSRKKETKLFSFSVLLNEDGDVVVEKQGLDPKAFKEAMDDWNDEYQNKDGDQGYNKEKDLRYHRTSSDHLSGDDDPWI